jgi:hypothetical protein
LLVAAVTALFLLVSDQDRPAVAQGAARASQNTEVLTFSAVADLPDERRLLIDTETEGWYFVPSWSNSEAAFGSQRSGQRFRDRSPFVVLDKRSKRWSSVAISRRAFEIYPARQDTEEKSLIWFGANDAPRGSIIDWAGPFNTTGAVDDPLVFSGTPGGLGLIDTARRTISYFGKYRDLVGGRVNDFLFEKDAVWIPARPYGTLELRGLSRFDRRTRTFAPFPIESHGYGDSWRIVTFAGSETTVSLSVLERDDWFNRYEFDKTSRRWRQPRYAWAGADDVPFYEGPDLTSKRIGVLQRVDHFGRHGHGHLGHPLVILEDRNDWQHVLTCRDVSGWVRGGVLVDTIEFFRRTLNDPATRLDLGNEGRRMFVVRANFYLPPNQFEKLIDVVDNSQLAAAVADGLGGPKELEQARRLLELPRSWRNVRESDRFLRDEFTRRQRALTARR